MPGLEERYERARTFRAYNLEDRMGDIESKLERGEIDPSVAREIMASLRWRAAKANPRDYGDKSQVQVEHTGQSYLEALRLVAERDKRPGDNAIDITPNNTDKRDEKLPERLN